MKTKTTAIALFILFVAAAALAGTMFYKNQGLKKEIVYLESKVDDLEDDLETTKNNLEEMEAEKEELSESLSEVQHFDEGSYGSSSSGLAYTASAMQTSIDGTFEGWDGDTIFKMMNGTIWQQASYDYEYHYAYNPDVLIYHKSGSYYMKVEGVDDEIRVTKLN